MGSRGYEACAGRAGFLLESPGESPVPLLFQIPKVTCIPWHVALDPSSKYIIPSNLCFYCNISSPILSLLPSSYKDPCDYTGPTG